MKKMFVVAAIIFSSPGLAQITNSISDSSILEQVTLTASKYSVKTTQTGKVVTILTRQDIEKAGSRDLSQIITELGGTFINGYTGNAGKEKNIYLRGAKVDHTLITIDGIPVYDATGIGSNFDIRNLAIDNIERIEILKGSQSTLYGSDAIAGVINIITKKAKPTDTKPTVQHVMHYGSFNTVRSGTTIGGRQGKFGYQAGFSHLSTNGISEAKPLTGNTSFEKDGYRQNSLDAQFQIDAAKGISIRPFFRYGYFNGDLDLDAGRDEKDFTNTNTNWQAGVRNEIKAGKGQLNVMYQCIRTKREYLDDSSYLDPNVYFLYNDQRYSGNEHFAEAFLVYPFKSFRLTAGSDFRTSNTSYRAFQSNVFSPGITEEAYSGDSINQRQIGVYAALNYQHANFSIEGGARLNSHSEYGSNFAFNLNPSLLIQQQVKVFANLSTGYKVPSLYQLFSVYGNTSLKPETSMNWEGGLQVFTRNQKNYLRATYFNRSVEDVIVFLSIPAYPYAQYFNQDKQKDHGFELEAQAKIANKIQVRSGFHYVNGEVETIQNGKDTSYFNLLRRPKSVFHLYAGWQVNRAFYFSAQVSHIGERKDIYFDPATFIQENITLKPYTLLNVSMEYAVNPNIRLFADIRNVLDKNYMDLYGYTSPGLNGYGGVRLKF